MNNKCINCGEDTSFGSGRFVNRSPADDGYICPECLTLDCDACGEDIELDADIKVNGCVYHEHCLIEKWQSLAMMISAFAFCDNEDFDIEERRLQLELSADKLVNLTRN